MFKLFGSLALGLIFSLPVQAQVSESIDAHDFPQTLNLIGKGIKNKATGEILGVACIIDTERSLGDDAKCNALRIVSFDQNRIPTWIGPTFALITNSEFQHALKKSYRTQYKKRFGRAKVSDQSVMKWMILGTPVVVGAGQAIFPAVSLFFGPLFWVSLGTLTTIFLVDSIFQVNLPEMAVNGVISPVKGVGLALNSGAGQAITQQTGWNWSEQPKEVSNSKFEKIKKSLSALSTEAL